MSLAPITLQVVNLFYPEIIVLAGSMSNIDRLYDAMPHRWRPYVFSDHVATSLVRNVHGDSSGVRQAAWLRS